MNYFNTLPLRLQLEQLGKCRFMDRNEFSDGVNKLTGNKVVIIGCGAQGLNQGLNMRDSGLDVSYALREAAISEQRASFKNASENGFTVGTYEELVPSADLVLNLTPDKQHSSVVNQVMPLMKQGASNERGRVINSLQADLQAVVPGLLQITRDVGNLWFLNFLTCRKGLLKLARLRRASLLKVPGIGATYADAIQAWQSRAFFAHDASLVGDMIQQDAARILELKQQIKALEEQIARIAESSSIARQLASIPGYGSVCSAELAGEIGTIERFGLVRLTPIRLNLCFQASDEPRRIPVISNNRWAIKKFLDF